MEFDCKAILRSIDNLITFVIRVSEKTAKSTGMKRQGNWRCSSAQQPWSKCSRCFGNPKLAQEVKNYLIKTLNGDVLTTEAECLDCWAEHFQQLLNCPPPQSNDDLLNKPASNDYMDTCIQPVTEAEVAAALKCLKWPHPRCLFHHSWAS